MSLDLSAEDRKALAKDLAAELDTGRYGSRFVLSRRQLLSIAGGSAGVAGLVALGVDPATAQSAAGQVGTASSPEDVFAFNLDVQGALQRDLDAGGQAITNAGSVSTGELNGKEATLTTDDTGEYRLVTTIGISSLWTTTNTSFEIVPDTEDAAIFDREKIGTNTNISSDLFVSVNYNAPATSASGTIRVAMSPNTEVGVGRGTDFGPIGLWEDPADRVSFELRSADGSQVEVRGVSINIWEQIA